MRDIFRISSLFIMLYRINRLIGRDRDWFQRNFGQRAMSSQANSPEEEGKPASEKRRHDDAECPGRLPFPLHLAAAGHRRLFRLRIGRLVHRRQRGQTGGDAVDLQVLVEKSGRHFAPEARTTITVVG